MRYTTPYLMFCTLLFAGCASTTVYHFPIVGDHRVETGVENPYDFELTVVDHGGSPVKGIKVTIDGAPHRIFTTDGHGIVVLPTTYRAQRTTVYTRFWYYPRYADAYETTTPHVIKDLDHDLTMRTVMIDRGVIDPRRRPR